MRLDEHPLDFAVRAVGVVDDLHRRAAGEPFREPDANEAHLRLGQRLGIQEVVAFAGVEGRHVRVRLRQQGHRGGAVGVQGFDLHACTVATDVPNAREIPERVCKPTFACKSS